MLVKNKLYKHHRSKVALVARNFSIALSSLFVLAAIVAIPTYIRASSPSEAIATEVVQNTEENKQEEVEVEEELITISEN